MKDLTTEELTLLDELLEAELDVCEAVLDSTIEHDEGKSLDEFMEDMADQHERINSLQVLRAKLREVGE